MNAKPLRTLYYNANVVTLDPRMPRSEGLLVEEGTIIALGTQEDLETVKADRRVDLDGATVVPGFDDCHMHILSMGLGLRQADLRPERAPSIADIQRLLGERVSALPTSAWVLGRGYNQNLLAERRHPTAGDLDAVTGGHPAVIWQTSGHVLVANSAALQIAGIGEGTLDPVGGEIERDDQGRPTGVIKETAMRLIRSVIPPATPQEAQAAIVAASAVLASEGITSASDAATGQMVDVREEVVFYRNALDSGETRTRVTLMPVIEQITGDKALAIGSLDAGSDPKWLSVGATKVFTDGALTTRTAAMRRPYLNTPGSGLLTWDEDELRGRCREAVDMGWPIACHAIGDRAIQQVLDIYQALDLPPGSRPRIEHATICDRDQIGRMKDLGVTVVLQPEDIAVLADAYPSVLGPEAAADNSPVGWFEQAGLPIAFSSDRPVTPGHPLVGVRAAVERRTAVGLDLGTEAHGVSAENAIRYYTAGSAYATKSESWKGSLRPGMAADFAVLDRDIVTCPSAEITSARVLMTVVDGEAVFEAS